MADESLESTSQMRALRADDVRQEGAGADATAVMPAAPATRRQATGQRAATRRSPVAHSAQAQQHQAERPAGAVRKAPAGPRDASLTRRGRTLARRRQLAVQACGALLALGCLVGLLFFARPTTSELEKRELTPFPELSVARFLDGSFFSDLSLWYGDTYPLREVLVGAGNRMKSLYGIQPKTQLVGGNVEADDLPAEGQHTKRDEGPVEVPTERAMAEAIQDQIMKGLYVDGGAAYNIYYFSQESVELYAEAINTCAANVGDQATVYSIIAPTSAGAVLDEQTLADLGGTDQRQAIRYFISLYDDSVHGINVYDILREHNDEYIYFRTDHHWTELGAYYAYLAFCEDKGVEPSDIMGRERLTFDGFLGTFYSEVGNYEMELNPDYVDAYVPNSTNRMTVWDEEGNELDVDVITDVSEWADFSKYNCFISGDRPLSKIVNPNKQDGSTCLVVKDSYGCAFVPLLVDDYETTWVIDFRYSSQSIPDFVLENDVDDVIFLNAIVLAGTDPVASALLAQVQGGLSAQGEAAQG